MSDKTDINRRDCVSTGVLLKPYIKVGTVVRVLSHFSVSIKFPQTVKQTVKTRIMIGGKGIPRLVLPRGY
jgi:hypothetical protein